MRLSDLEALVDDELELFESAEQRDAFQSSRITPAHIKQRWQYSDQEHDCFVVACDSNVQIIYCASGFWPLFPWSAQRIGETDLEMDGEWNAYLYESFISGMWRGARPHAFELKGPGERTKK